ncbi:MAG TPA: hypothetical protein VLJ37_12435 [bacterium]|nr:hypothetical protein [bacterium]
MKTTLLAGFLLLLLSFPKGGAQAQQPMGGMAEGMPPMAQMPQFQGMQMGVFDGTLVEMKGGGKKAPVPGQTVAIVVFQNGQRVLMLNKKTDEQGRFQFKNIFMDPSFSYLIGTMWNGKLYEMTDLGLKEGEKERKIELSVGEGSPYWVTDVKPPQEEPAEAEAEALPQGPSDLMRASSPPPASAEGAFSVGSYWEYPYQKIALVLSGIVALAGLYHLVQPERRD